MIYFAIIFLVVLSAIFSGLTLGFFRLDVDQLKRKAKLGNKNAKKVYPIRKKGNLLLSTLLLGNVAVNSAISILLGSVVSGLVAGLIATGLIVIFGEIVPQAVCARYALIIGAKMAWLVRIFIFIFYPITFILSWLLDKILGEEMPTIFSKRELKEIVKIHEDSEHSDLDSDEERIVLGALSFSKQTASKVMTPKEVVFSLTEDQILNKTIFNKIKKNGFTRIPVYKVKLKNIIGILFVKDLAGVAPGEHTAGELCRKVDLPKILDTEKLDNVLNHFIGSKNHMGFVWNEDKEFLGVITLEDIIEEVFGTEIVDETDSVVDMRKITSKLLLEN